MPSVWLIPVVGCQYTYYKSLYMPAAPSKLMTHDPERLSDSVSRRKFIIASGVAGITATMAGCTSGGDDGNGDSENGGDDGTGDSENGGDSGNGDSENGGDSGNGDSENGGDSGNGDMNTQSLTADGSSTVFPITNQASSLWNGNPPASDEEYWGPNQYDIDTEMHLADYFASLYGFEPTETRSVPPFQAQVG
jgi:phosphate transport system substrate-binding protein